MKEKTSTLSKAISTAFLMGYRVMAQGDVIDPYGERVTDVKESNGYPYIRVTFSPYYQKLLETNTSIVPIHQLACYQKFEKLYMLEGTVARHLNGNKADYRLNNIGIGLDKDNFMDELVRDGVLQFSIQDFGHMLPTKALIAAYLNLTINQLDVYERIAGGVPQQLGQYNSIDAWLWKHRALDLICA